MAVDEAEPDNMNVVHPCTAGLDIRKIVNKLPFLTSCRHPFLTPWGNRIPRGCIRPRPPASPFRAVRSGARPGDSWTPPKTLAFCAGL